MKLLDRVLALGDEDDRSEQDLKVRGLQLFLQFHIAVRLWFICFPQSSVASGEALTSAIAMASAATAAFVLGLSPRFARAALGLSMVTMLVKLWLTFPMSSNHFMIELLNLFLLLLLDPGKNEERGLLLSASRWITVIVIFYTGLQKIFYGTYFGGEFLAYSIATKGHFGDLFRLALPVEEFSRLIHSHPERLGAGPFRVQSPFFLLISNGVYVFEMLAPVILLTRRSRSLATGMVILFMVMVQSGARELFFGALMVQLLLLFLPRAWNYRLLPGFVAFYVLLLGTRIWWFPEFLFY